MLITWRERNKSALSSALTLTSLTLPSYWLATSFNMGFINLHGPHQGAQNSTTTGMRDLLIMCWNSAIFISPHTAPDNPTLIMDFLIGKFISESLSRAGHTRGKSQSARSPA